MYKIEISESFDSQQEAAASLRKIADLVEKGYLFGVRPVWDMEKITEDIEEDPYIVVEIWADNTKDNFALKDESKETFEIMTNPLGVYTHIIDTAEIKKPDDWFMALADWVAKWKKISIRKEE